MGNAAVEANNARLNAREAAGVLEATTPAPLENVLRNLSPSARRTLGGFMASGRLALAELRAADRWYRDYAAAVHGSRPEGGGNGGQGTPGGVSDAMVYAMEGHRRSQAAIGRMGYRLLVATLANDMSLRAVAEAIDEASNAYVAGLLVAVLKRLAEHYGDADSLGKKC